MNRHSWWGYVKSMVRAYPHRKDQELTGLAAWEQRAVEAAVEHTRQLPSGPERLRVVELVLWRQTHQIPGAALEVHVSEHTAARWHGDFIREVARNFSCKGLM